MLKILPLFFLFLSQIVLMAQDPQITQPPLGQTVTEGQAVQFAVVATGSNLVYQWQKDGVHLVDGERIGGSATATLTISGTQQLDAGSYSVVVTISGFPDLKVSSNGVLLKVSPAIPPAPQITLHPAESTVTEGQSVQFSVAVTGSNLVYQWAKDGEAFDDDGRISGASTATLSITGALETDEGRYSVVVTVAGFPELKVSSDGALLTVDPAAPSAPLISQQPAVQVVTLGDNAQFIVMVIGTNLTYQWSRDGVEIHDGGRFSGTSTAVLRITGAQTVDGGSYSVVVARADFPGLRTGSNGALLVVTPPGEHPWSGPLAPLMVDLPGGRYFGIRFSRLIGALGNGVRIQGSANLRDWIDATPSMVMQGSPVASGDGIRETVTFRCPLPISDPGAAGLRYLRLAQVDAQSPVVGAVNPVLGSVGGGVTLSVSTTGDPATGYDWYRGWALVGQTTLPQFQIPVLSPATAGMYRVVARNAYGSTTSAPFVVQAGGWTYGSWLAGMVGSGIMPTTPGYRPDDMPLGDGFSNFLKYAFGITPRARAETRLPQARIYPVAGANYLGIEFHRPVGAADVRHVIEGSADLKGWFDVTSNMVNVEVAANDDGVTERVGTRLSTPLNSVPPPGTPRFLRVKIPGPVESGFVLIPAGTFEMGDAVDGLSDATVHQVQLSAFHMARREVSKAEWDEVRTWGLAHGYADLPIGMGKAADHPVQTVDWYGMVKWCNARSEMEGLVPAYYTAASLASSAVYRTGIATLDNSMVKWTANGFRVPTEAEWEKAARGGLIGKRFPWGDTITQSQANYYSTTFSYESPQSVGYHPSFNTGSSPFTAPTGSFPASANGYGLDDVAGNVREWCWDWYGSYPSALQTDPRGPASGSQRVARGGSWNANAANSGVAFRYTRLPADTSTNVGFRVARSAIP